jgi:limonene-1,2-epoxide hydrolase
MHDQATDSPSSSTDRRNLLGSVALGFGAAGLAAVLGTQGPVAAQQSTSVLTPAEQSNVNLVQRFCAAWATLDLTSVTALMTDTAVYRMTEDTPPVSGGQALIDQMQPWVDTSSAIEFRILETFARGPLVVNHRIDTFSSDTRPLTWEGVGVFLIQDGLIREWFDYTIRVDRG